MKFSDPLYLLLLIPALGWLLFMGRQAHGMTTLRRRLAIGLRAAIIVLLVLALAGLQTARTNRGVSTVFVLDQSDSIRPEFAQSARAFISKSLEAMGPDDRAGLVVFGKDPVIDTDTGSLRNLGKIYSKPDPTATDIAAAIRLATAGIGEGTAKRLVLLTDGNETQGDAAEAASVARTEGVQIDYFRPEEPPADVPQVVLRDVVVPGEVTRGQPFQVRVVADSTAAASGVIHLDRGGIPAGSMAVDLAKGANSFVFSQTVDSPGFYKYRATLDVPSDPETRNKVGMGYVSVRGKPRVLILEGTPGVGQALAQALAMHGIDVVRGGPEAIPSRTEDLQSEDSVILDDFPAEDMTDTQMQMLAQSVSESGIGLGMIGGENSFLPGGYYGTPIADALPVDLNIRQRKEFPVSTIVIVLDTSGSMSMIEDGVEKVKIAASAAAGTVRMISSTDFVGVAGSTDAIEFVAPIQRNVNKDAICNEIGKLDVGGGGIYITPSLQFAEKALLPCKTQVKHLILMSDGDDAEDQDGAFEIARRMVAEHMTVSVVAIGDGKDVGFLRALATVGHGSYYLALHARELQRMFTRDAATMTRSAIEEGAFLPKVDPGDEALQGIDWRSMPPLYAYDLTSDRPLARNPMRTAKDDPLLAFWQYGLGTSMAFTSDAQPKWARLWMGWPGFNAFWAQAIRSTLRRTSSNKIQISARTEGGQGVVDLEAYDPAGNPINNLNTAVHVLGPDGQAQQVAVSQTGPGAYEGKFDASHVGGYIITAAQKAAGNGPAGVTRAGFAIAYPPEYQAVRPNANLLAEIAEVSGGKELLSPVDSFRPSTNPGSSVRDLAPLLLLLAALLFPIDVALRRLALPLAEIWDAIAQRIGALSRRRPRERQATAQTPALARLQAAKHSTRPALRSGDTDLPIPEPVPLARDQQIENDAEGQNGGRSETIPEAAPASTAERLLALKRQRGDKS